MELWIRNAGKTLLLKANEIYINPVVEYEEKGVVMCEDLFDLNADGIDIEKIENMKFGVYTDKRTLVATYSTKEKALKVLDEIQCLLVDRDVFIPGKDAEIKVLPKTCVIYQMPADEGKTKGGVK